MENKTWDTAGRAWLQDYVQKLFYAWKKTKQGRRYTGKGSPYKMGFSYPSWVDNAIDALNKDDEERFKAIKLTESMYI